MGLAGWEGGLRKEPSVQVPLHCAVVVSDAGRFSIFASCGHVNAAMKGNTAGGGITFSEFLFGEKQRTKM